MTDAMRHDRRAFAVWAMLAPSLLLSLLPTVAMPARTPDGTLTMAAQWRGLGQDPAPANAGQGPRLVEIAARRGASGSACSLSSS